MISTAPRPHRTTETQWHNRKKQSNQGKIKWSNWLTSSYRWPMMKIRFRRAPARPIGGPIAAMTSPILTLLPLLYDTSPATCFTFLSFFFFSTLRRLPVSTSTQLIYLLFICLIDWLNPSPLPSEQVSPLGGRIESKHKSVGFIIFFFLPAWIGRIGGGGGGGGGGTAAAAAAAAAATATTATTENQKMFAQWGAASVGLLHLCCRNSVDDNLTTGAHCHRHDRCPPHAPQHLTPLQIKKKYI